MLNRIVQRNLVNLRNASTGQKSFTDLGFNKLFIYFLDFFYNIGMIEGYVFLDLKLVRIFLKFIFSRGILNGVSFYLNGCSFTFKALKYLSRSMYVRNYLYFLTTSKGFCTLEELFFRHYNIGGILYFYIRLG